MTAQRHAFTIPAPGQSPTPALVVLSHLRWDFVWQRPQHLMTQAARSRPVLFVQTPRFIQRGRPSMAVQASDGVLVCEPQIPAGHSPRLSQQMTAEVLADLVDDLGLDVYDLWVYTPMELPVADLLRPRLVIYDCMDELSQFRFAPPELRQRERDLLSRADVVFTGGHRLYEAKREVHHNAHPFPSSVDKAHFIAARRSRLDPADQRRLARPRLGYVGVVDERLDYVLLDAVARRRPGWQFVIVGPVVKVDERELPRRPNIHYLGGKEYADLPDYLGHWDVALMPFALNAATEFISPTKTPEYLAAGLPVVSTPIRDVVRPWGDEGLVRIADGAEAFEAECSAALRDRGSLRDAGRRHRVDARLSTMSWRATWAGMADQLDAAAAARSARAV